MDRSRDEMEALFEACSLCPRACKVNRRQGKRGRCALPMDLKVARAALHFWEEPCISGSRGSGAVFFSGCSLGCAYCQNEEISDGRAGKVISPERLTEIFLEMEEKGAHNLNLVTAAHYAPWVVFCLQEARKQGFSLPVVYNSSGYESLETLKLLEGYVDIYLPDMKYADRQLAKSLSGAEDYPEVALCAIEEMLRQCGSPVYDEEGLLKRGTIIRHLILPGHTKNSKQVLSLLADHFGKDICVSVMNQYTPVGVEEGGQMAKQTRLGRVLPSFPELGRRVTPREYDKVLDHAFSLGLEEGYFQEGETARESFIPAFDGEGV